MNYIVLDLEFNQPFPFKSGKQTILNPECPFEIIQIGAVKLDESFQTLDSFNFLIKPQIYKRIHPFVEKITGITLEQIKNCPPFPDVYHSFIDFIGKEKSVLCTWGIDDIKSLYRNILYYNLNINSIPDQYINVQSFATSYLNYEQGKTIGLKNAVTELKLEIQADFHNALNDADYTAKIFKIVHPEEIKIETFNLLDLTKKKIYKGRIHIKALLQYFEKSLNRSLTSEETNLIKESYRLGRNQVFDIPSEKFKIIKNKGEKK